MNSIRYSQRLGSEVDVTTVSVPHVILTCRTKIYLFSSALSNEKQLLGVKSSTEKDQVRTDWLKLTVVDLLGPCQHPVPCSYFIIEWMLSSGPAHFPHVLQKKVQDESSVLQKHCKQTDTTWIFSYPKLVSDPPYLGFWDTLLKGQSL